MPDIMDILIFNRAELRELNRAEILHHVRDEIAAHLQLEDVHKRSPDAYWMLYHDTLCIITKVEDAGLTWREVGYDRERLMARGRRFVMPFLGRFVENIGPQLAKPHPQDKTLLKEAFTRRLEHELELARMLGLAPESLAPAIEAARALGLNVGVPEALPMFRTSPLARG